MLHIQTHIVDLFPDKENIITTRLLVPSRDVGCLEGKDGSFSHIRKLTGANVRILSREHLPTAVFGAHELVQVCLFFLLIGSYSVVTMKRRMCWDHLGIHLRFELVLCKVRISASLPSANGQEEFPGNWTSEILFDLLVPAL